MLRRFDARLTLVLALGAALSTLGCERDASGLTEWRPADHDHQSEPRQRHGMQTQSQRANPRSAPTNRNQVIDVTWQKQCATCHGRRGRGDGPSSTMVKARDLTNPEFQATLTDEQMAKVIREGKDKMPAFNLPDSIIQGLVQHVRSMVKKPRTGPGDDAAERGDDEAEEQEAPAAAPNAPASTSSVPAPAAPAPAAADTKPQTATQPPRAGAAPTAAPSAPSAPAQSAPAPSAPHP